MENYLGIKYTGKNKLTHKEMNIFLIEQMIVISQKLILMMMI